MFAHDFPAADALPPVSPVSIRAFLKVLANANTNAREQCRLNGYFPQEATTFTIDRPSVLALVSSIASGSEIAPEEAEAGVEALVTGEQNSNTRPVIFTAALATSLIRLVRRAEAVFRPLSQERSGNLISYSLLRSEVRSKQLGGELGSCFAAGAFHCAEIDFCWREDSPFDILGFDSSAVSDSETADFECILLEAFECGRLVSAVNDEFSSHLLAQAVGHAIASFCISQNPEG